MGLNATLNSTINFDRQSQTASAFTLAVPAIIAAIALVCLRFWPPGLDPKEPRLISSNIPFIGHATGMLRHQQRYFEMLRYDYYADMAITAFRSTISPLYMQLEPSFCMHIDGRLKTAHDRRRKLVKPEHFICPTFSIFHRHEE
jgi:hypothetical protein